MRAKLAYWLAAGAGLIAAIPVSAQEPSPEQLQAWVRELDAEDYALREEATRKLSACGESSIEALAAGVGSQSPEVAWRASESLQQIAIQGSEATLNRVVAALDKLSQNGKPGLSTVAHELRAKQIQLRHDRAAAQVRSLGGKLIGGGAGIAEPFGRVEIFAAPAMAVAVDFAGGEFEVMPAELDPEIRGLEALEAATEEADRVVREEMERFEKPVVLKALDAALERLGGLFPVDLDAELPPAPIAEPGDIRAAAPPKIVVAEIAPEPPQVPAADAVPAEEPAPPAAEAPLDDVPPPAPVEFFEPAALPVAEIGEYEAPAAPAEEFAEGPLTLDIPMLDDLLPEAPAEGEPLEIIADAMPIDVGFIGGPVFGGGFFIEEDAFPAATEGLSSSLTLDADWSGGDEGLQALRDLPSLTSLSIIDAKLTDAALEHIAALPNLQSLSIVNTRLSVESLLKYRQQHPGTRIFARGSAMLGIHADLDGACVLTGIYPNSGAAAAGLAVGDQIVTIDGHKISDFGDLTIAVYIHAPGEKLKVEFLRGGETKTAEVELKPRAELE